MDHKRLMMSLAATALMALVSGCGKSENPAPAPNTPDATKSAAPAAPAPPPQPAPSPATNASAGEPAISNALPIAGTAPAVPATPAVTPPAPTNAPASPTAAPTSIASLPQDQVAQGLQAALAKGLQQAVASLGHDGGFLTNLNVKIPMPEKLQKVDTAARALKQDKYADEFVATMNHAAELAVPEAAAVFGDALKQLTVNDAKWLLSGPNDAATQYFQKATRTNLYAKFYPLVKNSTAKTGVTAAYKNLVEKATAGQGLTGSLGNLGGIGSALQSSLLDKDTLDIDAYVTNQALDGLFKMVAAEEQQIRQNPAARTTALLQQVFGAVK